MVRNVASTIKSKGLKKAQKSVNENGTLDNPMGTMEGATILDPESKRIVQHRRWMRVMMEGQSTPDRLYQRAKG